MTRWDEEDEEDDGQAYWPILVTKDLDVIKGPKNGSHFDMGPEAYGHDALHVRYTPSDKVGRDELWILDERPEHLMEGGKHHEQFLTLYGWLANEYDNFGPQSNYLMAPAQPFGSNNYIDHGKMGKLFPQKKETYARTSARNEQTGIEGYYPSGTPYYYGDRRSVKVRGHRRRSA